jgi:hypothetical protein
VVLITSNAQPNNRRPADQAQVRRAPYLTSTGCTDTYGAVMRSLVSLIMRTGGASDQMI